MNVRKKYMLKGALVIGLPYILWVIFLKLFVSDVSMGVVQGFGILIPSFILGAPWTPIAFMLGLIFNKASFTTNLFAVTVLIAPIINGAIVGYIFGVNKEAREI